MDEFNIIEWILNSTEWIFSGIGTTVLSHIVTAVVSAFAGYKVGVRSTVKQIQKAGKNSKQYQRSTLQNSSSNNAKKTTASILTQTQEAGDHSSQKQIGDTNNDG